MTTRTLRIKVNVLDLIAKIEERRASEIAEYEKALARHPADVAAWAKKALPHLTKAVKELEAGDTEGISVDEVYRRGRYSTTLQVLAPRLPKYPATPSKPNTTRMDRDLAVLRVAADETITLSADDNLASYL